MIFISKNKQTIMSVKSQPMRIIRDSWMSPLLSKISLAMSKTMPAWMGEATQWIGFIVV